MTDRERAEALLAATATESLRIRVAALEDLAHLAWAEIGGESSSVFDWRADFKALFDEVDEKWVTDRERVRELQDGLRQVKASLEQRSDEGWACEIDLLGVILSEPTISSPPG